MSNGDTFTYKGVTYIVVGFSNKGKTVIGVNPNPKAGEPIRIDVLKSKLTKDETNKTTLH